MTEYHKINTIFKRDGRGRIVEDEYACPEFAYLANSTWEFTEKVNGTNIRITYDGSPEFRGNELAYVAGRTDNAQIPPHLLLHVVEQMKIMPFADVFPDLDAQVVLYCEGYGAKIGPQGRQYDAEGCGVALYDVRVGDWWLRRDDVVDVGSKLDLEAVPVIGRGTLADAVELTRTGFPSQRWPGVKVAEGLVLRPEVNLFNRAGERIITKIKHKDFTATRR